MTTPFARNMQRVLRTAEGKADSRNKLMKAIGAACGRLGMDDDARRDVQVGVTGKASMKDMDLAELGQVLDRLNRDWKGPTGHRAHIGKIRALWWTLYWLGALDDTRDRSIDVFVRRQTGVGALRFLDHHNAPAVIEPLKAWAGREGVEWPTAPDLLADRRAVVAALWRKLRDRRLVGQAAPGQYAAASIDVGADPERWTAHELDAVIKLLGKRYRRALGKDRADG